MKNLKLILITLITASFLVACDDGGSSSNNNGSDHADIKKAKDLVTQFEKSNIISKGHIRPQNAYDVTRTILNYSNNTANAFYQMHEIGCIKSDGSTELALNKQINTASMIVGTIASSNKKEKATYVQTNKLDNCYFAGGQITGGFGPFQDSKRWQWGQIPNCSALVTEMALRRVDKNQLNSVQHSSLQPQYGSSNQFDVNYWNDPRWRPYQPTINQEDSYFLLQRFGLSYYAPAVNDHFSNIKHGRAVFVTQLGTTAANAQNGCVKTVFYGHPISSNSPINSVNILIQSINN